MFLFAKFALVTCAFYLGIAILIDGATFALAHWKGSFGLSASKTGWIFFFGAVWLISFLISWRIVVTPLLARIRTT
jgi:hypothetical protein